MDAMETLERRLSADRRSPCPDLLEAALAGWRYWAGGVIPDALIQDIEAALGGAAVRAELAALLELGVLEETAGGDAGRIRLRAAARSPVEALLLQAACRRTLETPGGRVEAGDFLDQLVQDLQSAAPGASVRTCERGNCLLAYGGETYRLRLALSPFWTPLALEKREEEETCLLAFGPFASRCWTAMYPYFDVEAFRKRVALYDPWAREKLCLCGGGLPVYIDWFYRDWYQSRFFIPQSFCDALHNLGLMRYSDEC